MQLIIDGYNFMKSRKDKTGDFQSQRQQLLEELCAYQVVKKNRFEMTVVFDGQRAAWEFEQGEWFKGIRVIFSQEGEEADPVIIRLARQAEPGSVVVTSDRGIRESISGTGIICVTSNEFDSRLSEALLSGTQGSQGQDPGLGREDEELRPPLTFGKKKGNPKRRSKKDRQQKHKLNGL